MEGSVLALLGPRSKESLMPGVVDFKIHMGPAPPLGWKRSKAVLQLSPGISSVSMKNC